MRKKNWTYLPTILALVLVLSLAATGCNEDDPLVAPVAESSSVPDDWDEGVPLPDEKDIQVIRQDGSIIPGEIVEVEVGDDVLSFWPYTGTSLTDTPMDPINLVFKGQASPVQIRQALMSLDGDRTAFGFPDMAPFNQPWIDAVGGDVQTTYYPKGGWEGSVIQLTLGHYSGLRVHLRLFGSEASDGSGGTWTLGGAHFEMMIPGTSEHQVLSWELAEMIVTADLARCGLLGAEPVPTGLINSAPNFRSIPTFIYNPLVEDPMGQALLTMLGYPVAPQTEEFPLTSDGQGTVFQLAGALPITADLITDSVVIEYAQAIPRPVCSDGPYDWLYVSGPITFTMSVKVTGNNKYRYRSTYDANLQAVPIDIETYQPIGEPFMAAVSGRQYGMTGNVRRQVKSCDRRLALQEGAPELLTEFLVVKSRGRSQYKLFERCFDGK